MSQKAESTLSLNYSIPKKKSDQNYPENYVQQSILTNSYYNYNYYGNQGNWQQGSSLVQYPTMYQYPASTSFNSVNHVEPITHNIWNTLSTIKEKPKGEKKNIFKETVPDVDDKSLPKELTSLFQPLYCKLCSSQLSSNIMAKLHYKSKNHEKKVRKFLLDHSKKTGEPIHKRAKMAGTPKTENEKDPRWFYCEICDLSLTGKMHAESHYMGKNHHKAVMGYKNPSGKGFYNCEGKWVRQVKNKSEKDTGDTFGLDFRQNTTDIAAPEVSVPSTLFAKESKFHCDICNVGATCQDQIDMHYKGQKHQKKLKQLGINFPKPNQGTQSELNPENVNLSVYVTPSGGYYCPTCNLSLNSESQFKAHLNSKGHSKKNQQKLT